MRKVVVPPSKPVSMAVTDFIVCTENHGDSLCRLCRPVMLPQPGMISAVRFIKPGHGNIT